jgi:hypothetical protein
VFSDVNRGRTQSPFGCYYELKTKLESYSIVIGISAFITAGLMLLFAICGLVVCCSKKRRNDDWGRRFTAGEINYAPLK